MTSVTYPDTKVRTYHYEKAGFPFHLTGITDENGDRYATYGYDSSGRGNLSEHAGGAMRQTLVHGSGLQTTVTDALGYARTYYFEFSLGLARYNGGYEPCDYCGNVASSQTYDANGNLSTAHRLQRQPHQLHLEPDPQPADQARGRTHQRRGHHHQHSNHQHPVACDLAPAAEHCRAQAHHHLHLRQQWCADL